ncbi:unnamed protein product [Caenorhabditis auriculariae]|uniref:Uncharacterized protein n=1 Tax=Caenorhabditis auriculariae TaxID=2777116 RepID=A0A8S1I0M7_9PELO|nr:unnamed protein product [Caenorhabditis auriculariae]
MLSTKFHDRAIGRKKKFEEKQPLDPIADFFSELPYRCSEELESSGKRELTEEFIEAGQKFEAVKKAHQAGKEFEPPQGTRIWSDLRLQDRDKMEIAKLPEQQMVERKQLRYVQKCPPAAFLKRRQKAGLDPPSKATTSVVKTEESKMKEKRKEDPKAEERKKEGPKAEEKKKEDTKAEAPKKDEQKAEERKKKEKKTEGPKKDDAKKEEAAKQGDAPIKCVKPEDIVKRVLKEDQPKMVFIMPHENIQLENCHPLSLSSPVQAKYDTFKTKSKVLSRSDKSFSVAYDHLKRLRVAANPNEKRLLELLEAGHAEMANQMHAEGLNYYYWHKKFINVPPTVLPGESLGDAARRIYRFEDRYKEIEDQLAYVRNLAHPNEKAPETDERTCPDHCEKLLVR